MLFFVFLCISIVGYWVSALLPRNFLRGSKQQLYCGLFGYSGMHPVDKTKIRWLASLNETRGRHSTGIFTVKDDKKQTTTLTKDIVEASKYIQTDEFNNAINGAVIVIGHTRAATTGGITVENAHPFSYDFGEPIVGAHNGFVADVLLEKYLKDYKFDTVFDKDKMCDSQIIFAMLSKFNGDISKLSEIEGGLNLLFAFPHKNNHWLFAYKREARALHYGQSPEGVYLSSDNNPLDIIGCYNISALEDNCVTIFKDGQILDIQGIDKPKWAFPLHTNSGNYQTKLSINDKNSYEETKHLAYVSNWSNNSKSNEEYWNGHYNYKYHNIIPSSFQKPMVGSVNPADDLDDTSDRFKMLVKDIIKETSQITGRTPIENAKDAYDYDFNELTDTLLVVSLVDSVKNDPLPGWSVIDKEDQINICGITGVNGNTLLKYPTNRHGTRILELYDPIDGKFVYTYTIMVKTARIMEVVLELPFPQNLSPETTGTKDSASSRAGDKKLITDCGAAQSSSLVPENATALCVLSTSEFTPNVLPKKEKSVHLRDKKPQTPGVIEIYGETEGNNNDPTKLRKERDFEYTEWFAKAKLSELVRAKGGSNIQFFDIKKTRLQDTSSYRRLATVLRNFLGNKIDVDELLSDATVLSVLHEEKRQFKDAINFYTIFLLTEACVDYVYPAFVDLDNNETVSEKFKKINDFVTTLHQGMEAGRLRLTSTFNTEYMNQ